jgi:hypothetical protein
MNVAELLVTLQGTAIAGLIRGDQVGAEWLFPIIETCHVLALATVFGTIVMVDFRLLGISSRASPVSRLSAEVLPWTWLAFMVAAVTGALMFLSKAETYWGNLQFRLKFLCMLLAGINMLLFQFGIWRSVSHWETTLPAPAPARVAGALSLLFWCGVIFFGRWIGFTT